MAGLDGLLLFRNLQRIPDGCPEHAPWDQWQPGFPTFSAKASRAAASGISEILSSNFAKAEGLAFIFAVSFNMPCVSALAASARATHSVLWTAKTGVFYTLVSLLLACVAYHSGPPAF